MRSQIAVLHTSDDAELISESLTHPESFAGLFDRYAGMIYRYVTRRLGPEPAEDLVGETFLVAFQRRGRYDLSRPDARPWLFGIVTKLISRHRRAEAARYRALARAPLDAVLESPADAVAAEVTAAASRPALIQALGSLSPGDRDVLLLIAWGDLSYEETAVALTIPIGTVRSRLNRARRKVRESLNHTNPLHEPPPDQRTATTSRTPYAAPHNGDRRDQPDDQSAKCVREGDADV